MPVRSEYLPVSGSQIPHNPASDLLLTRRHPLNPADRPARSSLINSVQSQVACRMNSPRKHFSNPSRDAFHQEDNEEENSSTLHKFYSECCEPLAVVCQIHSGFNPCYSLPGSRCRIEESAVCILMLSPCYADVGEDTYQQQSGAFVDWPAGFDVVI